jgi:hypothetical protein
MEAPEIQLTEEEKEELWIKDAELAMNCIRKLFGFIWYQGRNGQTNAAYDVGRLIFKSFAMTAWANETYVLYKFGDGEQKIGDINEPIDRKFVNEFLQFELMM